MATAILQQSKRSMRIIALPLTTASRTSKPEHLTYYHFVTPPPIAEKRDKLTKWTSWASGKAAQVWGGFGQAPEGHWKRRTFIYGERLVDRIDFEELALKSVDPSLGPKIIGFSQKRDGIENTSSTNTPESPLVLSQIPLIYPPSACSSPMSHLRTLLEKRTPRHKRGFIMWMIIAPLTAPFMIIPIIPNLPFFFCVWRSWSHWRAYKASSYLEEFLNQGAIVPQESKELDEIYAKYSPPLSAPQPPPDGKVEDLDPDASSTSQSSATSSSSSKSHDCNADFPQRLVLTREAVPAITSLFGLKAESSFANDVYRALEQARLRMVQNDESNEETTRKS